ARQGIPADWLDAASRSPVYALIARHQVALPLHPEYRTLPMVWYIPPLSPVADVAGAYGDDADAVFAAIEALRIPAEYLANLFTAGDAGQIRRVLRVLAAVRTVMRAGQLGLDAPDGVAQAGGMTENDMEDLYRLLAIAKYDDRYVIPLAHAEDAGKLLAQHELLCAQPGGDGEFHLQDGPVRDSDGRLHLGLSPQSGDLPP